MTIHYSKSFLRTGSIIIAMLFGVIFTQAQTFVKANDQAIATVGRINFGADGSAEWTWPAAQFYCTFTGTSIKMKTKPGSSYFVVKVDDEAPRKVQSVKGTDGIVELASGLSAGNHRLELTYAVEGSIRHPAIYGFLLDDGAHLGPKPQLPTRKMEFIGNSITCALGNEWDGTTKNYNSSMQNIYYSYEALAARELNAQWQVVARSGIGIYRNTCGNVEGDRAVMPAYYPFANVRMSGQQWDFSRYQPDVVCVNLGTNDTTNPRWNDEKLQDAFKKFVKALRGYYPKAKIVLLTGTMINGKRLLAVQQAQQAAIDDARSRGDNEVYRFDFTPADGSLGYGYGHHPSKRQHAKMAAELVPFIRQITGWNN